VPASVDLDSLGNEPGTAAAVVAAAASHWTTSDGSASRIQSATATSAGAALVVGTEAVGPEAHGGNSTGKQLAVVVTGVHGGDSTRMGNQPAKVAVNACGEHRVGKQSAKVVAKAWGEHGGYSTRMGNQSAKVAMAVTLCGILEDQVGGSAEDVAVAASKRRAALAAVTPTTF
jgi:hypothetical protein